VPRIASYFAGLALLLFAAANGQVLDDRDVEEQLKQLFPAAASFSPKTGSPPHFKVFGPAGAGGEPELIGLAWWTTEIEPLERGFDGPIKMLVGMDTKGVLTGLIVTEHREPYGYFSVDLPDFAEQFEQKNIRDRFRVGEDIDAISRATITIESSSRAVRNSARKIARAYLAPPSAAAPTAAAQ
jgi:NosR/NirI family nitrous oxide reductase transcriptional regulator